MANDLLKTLEKIDTSRRVLIDTANANGFNLSKNASLIELASTIGTIDHAPVVHLPAWERPKEWPDCADILRKATNYSSNSVPHSIILLKDCPDEYLLPKKYTSSDVNGRYNYTIAATSYKTSNGYTYGSTSSDITHHWDGNGDIIIEDGPWAGTYRWIIVYAAPNNSYLMDYSDFPNMIEVLIKGAGTNDKSKITVKQHSQGQGYGAPTLVNFSFLEEALNTQMWLDLEPSYYCSALYNLPNLQNLDLTYCPTMDATSTNSSYQKAFSSLPKLTHLIIPETCTITSKVGTVIRPLDSSNRMLNHIHLGANFTLALPTVKNLKIAHFYAPNCTVGSNSLLNANADITIKENTSTPLQGATINKGLPSNTTSTIFTDHPTLAVVDLTAGDSANWNSAMSVLNDPGTSSYTKRTLGVGMPRLRYVQTSPEWVYRIDVSNYILSKENLLEILDNLLDLTTLAYDAYDPYIVFGPYNMYQLSKEELAIATNKGWVIE